MYKTTTELNLKKKISLTVSSMTIVKAYLMLKMAKHDDSTWQSSWNNSLGTLSRELLIIPDLDT